jgi:carbamoyl-phosphate synthase small subunit
VSEAILALADGTVFRGRAFGAIGETTGELVFNTSMTGYQEILTDPSYEGQLVAMTYPEIGNVGVNEEDVESRKVFVRGFVVREYREVPSSWRAQQSLGAYLETHGVPGIEGIDTRALVRHLRDHGAQEAVLSSADLDAERLVKKAKASPGLVGRDLVRAVTTREPYEWHQGPWRLSGGYGTAAEAAAARGARPLRVIAYDYGIKFNILRNLVGAGCAVRVVPATTPASEVLGLHPDGVFLSNGPGDPDAVAGAREAVADLLGKVPVFGICLGHQILGLALGADTYKLRFGHHGGNHPVRHEATGRVEITSQNHNYAVSPDALSERGRIELTHINLNDGVVEGFRVLDAPAFGVQHHPEAGPGPHDARYLFDDFTRLMTGAR